VVVDADASGKSTAIPTGPVHADTAQVAAPVRAVILNQPLADKPISPLLYGNFIELGFGQQIEGMWAEMLFNRSFEDWPKPANDQMGWLGHSLDEDLTKEPWWHNGYERAPWAATGEPGKYVWNPSWLYWMRQATLDNDRASMAASFYQTGLVVRAGMTYHFHGQLKCGGIGQFAGPATTVTVGLYKGGSLEKPLVTRPVKIQGAWAEYTCDLPVSNYAGRATFAVSVPAGQTVHRDCRKPRSQIMDEDRRAVAGTGVRKERSLRAGSRGH
jgi:hypothetical protein